MSINVTLVERRKILDCSSMRSLKITVLCVCLIILTSYACGPISDSISIPINAKEASLVFLGTVVKPVDGGTKDARAVRVDRVYFQRGMFDDPTGSEVIVVGKDLPASGLYVFHVEPSQFGARIQAELKYAEPRKSYTEDEVKQLRHAKRKLELLKRVKGADLIFVGLVESTRPRQGKELSESEHDPVFTWATAKVGESLLGQVDGTNVEFLFAASKDVHWWRSPKPQKGANVMFLLRKGAEEIDKSLAGTWTLLHKDDLLKGEDINIVREIVSEGGAK